MTCRCSSYARLSLRPEAISLRVRQARAIRPTLVHLADRADLRVSLYRCAACGALWQGSRSRVAFFGQEECLYRVPSIEVEAWRAEPFVKPQDVALHEAAVRHGLRGLACPPPPAGRPLAFESECDSVAPSCPTLPFAS